MKKLLPLFLVLFFSCQKTTIVEQVSKENNALAQLFESIDKFSTVPEDSLYKGYHPHGKWSSNSYTYQQTRVDSLKKYIDAIAAISDATLTDQERISKAVMLINLRDQIDNVTYKMLYIPFNAEGGFYNSMSYAISSLPSTVQKIIMTTWPGCPTMRSSYKRTSS